MQWFYNVATLNGPIVASGDGNNLQLSVTVGGQYPIYVNGSMNLGAGALTVNSVSGGGSASADNVAVVLNTANTYSGGTVLTNYGSVKLGNPNALGNGGLLLYSNSLLNLNTNYITVASLSGANGSSITDTKALAGTTTLTVNQSATTTYAGVISDGVTRSVALAKVGAGTLTLSGSNTITGGVTLNAGSLILGNTYALGSSGTFTINGGTLGWSASGDLNIPVGVTSLWAGNFTYGNNSCNYGLMFAGPVTLSGGTRTITYNCNNNWQMTVSSISDGGNGYGLTLLDAATGTYGLHTFIINGASTYGGDTTVSGYSAAWPMTLNAGVNNAMPYGSGKGSLNVNDYGAFNVNGKTVNINGLNGTALGTVRGGGTLTLGNGDASGSFAGVISGTLSLAKVGTGTQTLSGTNTYTGATAVSAGTLAFLGGSQMSPITVSNGAFLGFILGSATTSTSTVTLIAGAKVKITGTPALASYTLLTASAITGTPVLDTPIAGYQLVVNGGKLNLIVIPVLTGVGVSGGNLSFDVTNYGGSYVVQGNTNLANLHGWVSISTNPTPFTFTDSNAVNFYKQRFYRVVLP